MGAVSAGLRVIHGPIARTPFLPSSWPRIATAEGRAGSDGGWARTRLRCPPKKRGRRARAPPLRQLAARGDEPAAVVVIKARRTRISIGYATFTCAAGFRG